ncbi:MAG: hypothetical protein M3P46_04180 [Actinomycetota bacterium]|nr:hypothetical protein [Actinomycetota bacterium]
MIVLGVVLLVLATLLTLGTVFFNPDPASVEIFGVSLANVSVGGLFLAGVVTGVVGMLGLSLALGGGARKAHKRSQRKREVQSVRGQAETLEQENARLREELHTRGGTGV